jgi:signal transduction histidine kinase
MSRWHWPRLGLRREVLLLVPLAMLALVLLSAFSLIAYRNGIDSLRLQRRDEASRMAWLLAQRLADEPALSLTALRAAAPQARRLAVVDGDGRTIASLGRFEGSDPLAPLAERPAGPLAVGPDADVPDAVAGFAPLRRGGRNLTLRVDLAADDLARQLGALRILTWVALPLNLAVVGLVFLFLRYLLKPFETLLQQARRVESAKPEGDDEIVFLIDTFERAVTALAGRQTPAEAEIETLQRALAPSLESGLLLLDRQGGVLALNALGRELLEVEEPAAGTPAERALGRHPELVKILRAAAASGQGAARQETEVRTAEGRRTLGLTVHALRRDDGAVRGFLVLFVDLTEVRRQAEEERLAEGLAQLGELAAGVAHELRNGLATLRGYLTLVEQRPEDGTLTDYLEEMRRESDHLVRVVGDFLTFARPESARVEPVELTALARRAAADPALAAGAVRVTGGTADAMLIRGDADLLERALKNLLHNAVRAQRDAGETAAVVCRVERSERALAIVVEDRGGGLPAEVRQRLFQPFVTGRTDGVGLGLSLAHRIVGLHGGTLRLEDREDGGTRAVISFPADVIAG